MKNETIMEFHVSRKARDRYGFDEAMFSLSGNVVFANFHGARIFAQKMNLARDLKTFPDQAVKPGQITAMGLIDEILHYVVSLYRKQINKNAIKETLETLYETLGRDEVKKALRLFTDQFPPVSVYKGEISLEDYMEGATGDTPHYEVALEEMLLLWLANMNPAFAPFMELFDDTALRKNTIYPHIIAGLRKCFDTKPGFGPDNQHLVDMLRSPAVMVPHSLAGQLDYIRERWGVLLKRFLRRILKGLDIFKEEEKLTFMGPGRARVYRYKDTELGFEYEAEQFSPDRDWMPRLVLMAKNIYVWLDQLSKKYGRSIARLDQIPDQELDILAHQGFSGLWLIGVWERSPSSQKIKQLCGNPEAVPSAYSLYDYTIADDLGGEGAYESLRDRSWRRGIRLASDMVPNHVGIYSRWTVEHPDWFVSLDYNPFPWYSFGGPDLSHDGRVGIFTEDHYYNRTDAAVVFKRVDRWTGSEKYVYHGNDGTSMPWNDTAQLNYLNPEVREAMIQTILHVARKFPVIRFDAAMTLTKRHYQRLWFPEPGKGGAIPTRAEYGLTKDEFNEAMPKEFWREVVDRVAEEAPDTLLLAEAFWLLEGYFVRSLGMHRVYNSAFMNMLRDEENAGYRQVIKNTLEFDPEVLRRFVNFMNNPDERTAVDQFGKEGKYFGVCVLMITMPGLPMFGHGQIEGFTEKYGMEYRRAYFDERADKYLMERHEREVFPLLHRRYLFAGVEHFLLYDFFTPQGQVNEDVFAYSNRYGHERAVVAYHNKYAETAGWIRMSAAYSVKTGSGDTRDLIRKSLGEGLSLSADNDRFTIFRDHLSNLWFIRENKEIHEKGLYMELGAYEYHLFLDFQEKTDNEWHHFSRLNQHLNGRGVPDLGKTLEEMLFQPVLQSLRELINPDTFRNFAEARGEASPNQDRKPPVELVEESERKMLRFLREIGNHGYIPENETETAASVRRNLESLMLLPPDDPAPLYPLLAWAFLSPLGDIPPDWSGSPEERRALIDEWFLDDILTETFEKLEMTQGLSAGEATTLVRLLVKYPELLEESPASKVHERFAELFRDDEAGRFLGVNEYEHTLWFSRDRLHDLMTSSVAVRTIASGEASLSGRGPTMSNIEKCRALATHVDRASERAGYRVERLLDILKEETISHEEV